MKKTFFCLDPDSVSVCLCCHLAGNANNLLLIKLIIPALILNLPGAQIVFVFCLSDSPPFSGQHPSSVQPPIMRAKWDTIHKYKRLCLSVCVFITVE